MKQEDKELLLKDLCARFPYGVKCKSKYFVSNTLLGIIIDEEETIFNFSVNDVGFITQLGISDIKPYLFPLSSMTEEQKEKFDYLLELELKAINDEIDHTSATAFEVDFYNKYHLDYRGLIPMGLAIDATGLNIY